VKLLVSRSKKGQAARDPNLIAWSGRRFATCPSDPEATAVARNSSTHGVSARRVSFHTVPLSEKSRFVCVVGASSATA
jgi:hypothetical protein